MATETTIHPNQVELHETDLFEAFCFALESGEFTQVRKQFRGEENERCAWGVAKEIAQRVGLAYWYDVHPRFTEIERGAGAILGYDGIASANDAGCTFLEIAAALRQARTAIEPGS